MIFHSFEIFNFFEILHADIVSYDVSAVLRMIRKLKKKNYLHTANHISTSIGQSSQKSMYVKLFFSYPIKSIYLYSDVKQ